MWVRLTKFEMLQAAQLGCMRCIESLVNGHRQTYGAKDLWPTNVEGALGEAATAKALCLYHEPIVNQHDRPDVGPYEVRTNMSRQWTDTALHPEDKDDRVYIGVLSFAPEFEIIGWIWGWEGKDHKYWRDGAKGRPAFWVPRHVLYSMETLPPLELFPDWRAAP